MTLHPCRECGDQISSEAPTCPHCGSIFPAGSAATVGDRELKAGWLCALVGFFLAMLGMEAFTFALLFAAEVLAIVAVVRGRLLGGIWLLTVAPLIAAFTWYVGLGM